MTLQYNICLSNISPLSAPDENSHTLKNLLGNPTEGEESVDIIDYPIKEAAIHGLSHSVLSAGGLFHCVVAGDDLSFGHHTVGGQGLSQVSRVNAKQFRHWWERKRSVI